MTKKERFYCELCGADCTDEFGDLNGAIVCPTCLGWYDDELDPCVEEIPTEEP